MKFKQITILVLLTILLMGALYDLLDLWEEHSTRGSLAAVAFLVLGLVVLIATLFFRFMRQSKGDQYEL